MIRTATLASVSLLVALLLAEATLALFAPQVTRSPRVWQHDAALGWANRPGAVGRLVSPEFDVEFRIDEAGLRGPAVAQSKPPGTLRVAILGDSFAQGWGVAEADTVRARLETSLRERGRAPVEVLNFGVAGYGTDQALLTFRTRARDFAPDVVVLVACGNDLWDNGNATGNGGGGRFVPRPHFQVGPGGSLRLLGSPVARGAEWEPPRFPSRAWLSRLGADGAQRSHLATLLHRALRPAEGLPSTPFYYERIYARRPDGATQTAWKLTARLIGALAGEVRASDARFVLLYASDRIEVDPQAWQHTASGAGFPEHLGPDVASAAFERAAAAHAVDFVDLRAAVLAAAAEGPFFFEERHWNARGHALAARALAERLSPRGAPQ